MLPDGVTVRFIDKTRNFARAEITLFGAHFRPSTDALFGGLFVHVLDTSEHMTPEEAVAAGRAYLERL